MLELQQSNNSREFRSSIYGQIRLDMSAQQIYVTCNCTEQTYGWGDNQIKPHIYEVTKEYNQMCVGSNNRNRSYT